VRNPTGYGAYTTREQDRPLAEYDTTTCGHCQRVIFVKPATACTTYLIVDRATNRFREEPGAFCRVCMQAVCLTCHADGRCTPWERRIEAMEARGRFLQQVGAQG